METTLSILLGIGLSAACGFRVFVPLLCMSIAASLGYLDLSPEFAWIGTPYALTAFAIATGAEVAGYYIPGVDHLLDTLATPAAVVAGTVTSAAVMMGDVSPLLKWSLAMIAGGGIAGAIQAGTMALRGASTATTAGLGNPLVAMGELAGATLISVIAIAAPVAAFVLILIFGVIVARVVVKKRAKPS